MDQRERRKILESKVLISGLSECSESTNADSDLMDSRDLRIETVPELFQEELSKNNSKKAFTSLILLLPLLLLPLLLLLNPSSSASSIDSPTSLSSCFHTLSVGFLSWKAAKMRHRRSRVLPSLASRIDSAVDSTYLSTHQ